MVVSRLKKLSWFLVLMASFSAQAFPLNVKGYFETLPNAKAPFSLATPGAVYTVDLDATRSTYTYAFYLSFMPGNDAQELQRVATVLGFKAPKNGATYRDDQGQVNFVRTGAVIPIRLTISRAEGAETLVYDKQFQQLWGFGGNNSTLSRAIDFVRLEPGHYRVRVEVIAAVNELASVPVSFNVGLPGKH